MRSIRFNTGRYYGPDHQPIHVRLTTSTLMFDDEARGILGEIPAFPARLNDASTTEYEIQMVVMAAYDNGLYNDGSQAVWDELGA